MRSVAQNSVLSVWALIVNISSPYALRVIFLSGAAYGSVFTRPQLDALALGFLKLNGSGAGLVMAFWGLWLFPFGILVIQSGFFPRILGVLLMVAGSDYLTSSFTSIILPAYRHAVFHAMMPLYFGEVPIILWLLHGSQGAVTTGATWRPDADRHEDPVLPVFRCRTPMHRHPHGAGSRTGGWQEPGCGSFSRRLGTVGQQIAGGAGREGVVRIQLREDSEPQGHRCRRTNRG